MTNKEKVKFYNKDRTDFFIILRTRVDQYFKENNISTHANFKMVIKTISMLLMFFVPYTLILTNTITPWFMLVLAVLLGLGKAGIGMSIMHDANHGGYSSKAWVNKIVGYTMELVGGSSFTWKIQHNILHHTYTNIYEHDEDIDPKGLMRFTPSADFKSIHKYQYIYAVFIYGLMTLFWSLHKDFKQLLRYDKQGFVNGSRKNLKTQFSIIIFSKAVYYSYMMLIPLLLVDIAFWQWIIGYLTMHFVAGVVLALTFQLAHVVEETEFPVPSDEKIIENEWAIHQLQTTNNFARKSKLLSWYLGGLNFQIEHHLFPKICHIHYNKISGIVMKTAKEFNLSYHDHPTLLQALQSHFHHLKMLGRPVKFK